MNIKKVGPDRYVIRLLDENGVQLRKVFSRAEVLEFVRGGPPAASNLSPGRQPVAFAVFVEKNYLPLEVRPRMKDSSFQRETDAVRALSRYFGEMALHKITLEDWKVYRQRREAGELSARARPTGPSTLLKEFKCLRSVLSCAERAKVIRNNPLAGVMPSKYGLYDQTRADIWLKREEIFRVLDGLPSQLRPLFEFRVWTGARPGEACQVGPRNLSIDGKTIWIPTIKKHKGKENVASKRTFRVASLGSRFSELLGSLTSHPQTGLFFCNPETGQPYVARYLQQAFKKAVEDAHLDRRVVPYDLRGTFCMHRAMVVKSFWQLQTEMGHASPKSIRNYLAEASHCDPKESIFYGVNASWNEAEGVTD